MERAVTQRGVEGSGSGSGRSISLDRIEAEQFSIEDNSRDALSDGGDKEITHPATYSLRTIRRK
jgi:hypothetical protein